MVRFQDGYKHYLTSNQLIVVIVENSSMEKEPEVTTISEIPDEAVPLEKG